jgi:peptidylprolyl isomerase
MLTRTWTIALLSCAIAASSACGRGGQPASSQTEATPQIPAPPDVSAPPADAARTATGLASKVLRPGTGTRHPRPNSRVMVHYTGWTTDGKMFDSSVARNEPATFGLDEVIAGWTQGVQMMVEGEKRRFWIPGPLAYEGKDGPQGLLVFDIELLKIES